MCCYLPKEEETQFSDGSITAGIGEMFYGTRKCVAAAREGMQDDHKKNCFLTARSRTGRASGRSSNERITDKVSQRGGAENTSHGDLAVDR